MVPVCGLMERTLYYIDSDCSLNHCETALSVCVQLGVGYLLTLTILLQKTNATVVTHEDWGGGPLSFYWPTHFSGELCACVCVCVHVGTSSAVSLFPLGHMCCLVLSRLRVQQ